MSPFMGRGVMGKRRKGARAAHERMQRGPRANAGMFVIFGQDMNRVASRDNGRKRS